jgi:hypothetical protein
VKKLTITAEVPLPDDDFEAAKVLADLQDTLREFRDALLEKRGTVEHKVMTVREPKKQGPRAVAAE